MTWMSSSSNDNKQNEIILTRHIVVISIELSSVSTLFLLARIFTRTSSKWFTFRCFPKSCWCNVSSKYLWWLSRLCSMDVRLLLSFGGHVCIYDGNLGKIDGYAVRSFFFLLSSDLPSIILRSKMFRTDTGIVRNFPVIFSKFRYYIYPFFYSFFVVFFVGKLKQNEIIRLRNCFVSKITFRNTTVISHFQQHLTFYNSNQNEIKLH